MENISNILKFKNIPQRKSKRPINLSWEEASEFASYVGLSTPYVLRLIKIFGKKKVFDLRSWLKDAGAKKEKGGKSALIMWKLQQKKDKQLELF